MTVTQHDRPRIPRLADILHRVVAQPVVYDAVQAMAGASELNRRLAARIGSLPPRALIVDVGGGTGLPRSMLPDDSTYVCLDPDPVKLRGFMGKHRPGYAVCGDAAALPLPDGTVDLAVCKDVGHHLTDPQLALLFRECNRVLRLGARMIFIDAALAADRLRSRALWRYDRGSHPRSHDAMKQAMESEFQITEWETFAIIHRYVLGVGQPRTDRRTGPP
jgi:SAM-dependent methyltransferase